MIRAAAAWAADLRSVLDQKVIDPDVLADRIADPLGIGPALEQGAQRYASRPSRVRTSSGASSPSR